MTDHIVNYQDVVVGVQAASGWKDLTKYLTDFDLSLDSNFESGTLGGRKTDWSVPTGSMLTAALNGYVLDSETPKFSEIFAADAAVLFMIYYATTKRAFAFRAFVNTDGIVRQGGVQAMSAPLMVTQGDWTARLGAGDTPAIANGAVAEDSYVFAYLTAALTGTASIEQGPNSGTTSDVTDLSWDTGDGPGIYYAPLAAGAGQDVILDTAEAADKPNILWGIARPRV